MTRTEGETGMNGDRTAMRMVQEGLKQIEEAILELLHRNPQGLRNVQVADILGLRSIVRGDQRDYLAYSVLGGLLDQGKISWDANSKLYYRSSADNTVQSLAQEGLTQIEEAILALLAQNPQGLRNIQIADMLHLHSAVRGGRRNYLTYSILGGLLVEGKIARDEKSKVYTKT